MSYRCSESLSPKSHGAAAYVYFTPFCATWRYTLLHHAYMELELPCTWWVFLLLVGILLLDSATQEPEKVCISYFLIYFYWIRARY